MKRLLINLESQKIKPNRDHAMNAENIETIKQLFAVMNVMYLFAKNIALVKLHVTIAILLKMIVMIETLPKLFN